MHHHFFLENLLKIVIIFKLIATIEEMHFILLVVDGIYIIIHNDVDIVYLHVFNYE